MHVVAVIDAENYGRLQADEALSADGLSRL